MTDSEVVTLDFTVTQVVGGSDETVDVYCPGTGIATRQTFTRGHMPTNSRHTPYSLAAAQWFLNHPKPAKVWVVGNIVPRETRLEKWWVAAPVPGRGVEHWDGLPRLIEPGLVCRGDREILWIEP